MCAHVCRVRLELTTHEKRKPWSEDIFVCLQLARQFRKVKQLLKHQHICARIVCTLTVSSVRKQFFVSVLKDAQLTGLRVNVWVASLTIKRSFVSCDVLLICQSGSTVCIARVCNIPPFSGQVRTKPAKMVVLSLKICVRQCNVVKTMQFEPSTAVYDACRIIRERVPEAQTGQGETCGVNELSETHRWRGVVEL